MSETTPESRAVDAMETLQLTTDIVSAYVSNHSVPADQIAQFMREVHGTLTAMRDGENAAPPAELKPAVPVKKSITPDYIICLEDGKKLKMLKRYLRSQFNLSPEEYRRKWGLPSDYPMVAPNYAKKRSEFAKKIGLGRTGAAAARSAPRKRATKKAAKSA